MNLATKEDSHDLNHQSCPMSKNVDFVSQCQRLRAIRRPWSKSFFAHLVGRRTRQSHRGDSIQFRRTLARPIEEVFVGAALCGRPSSNRSLGNTKGGHRGPPPQLYLLAINYSLLRFIPKTRSKNAATAASTRT